MPEGEQIRQQPEQRKRQIETLGFEPINKTGLYQIRDSETVVYVDPENGQYHFLFDYFGYIEAKQINALTVKESGNQGSLLRVLVNDPDRAEKYGLEHWLNGSGGGIWDPDREAILNELEQRALLPISEQLLLAGFKKDEKAPEVWKKNFAPASKKEQEVMVIVEDGQILRILKPLGPQLVTGYKIGEEVNIVAVGKKDGIGTSKHDKITLENSLLRFDLISEQGGMVENVRLSREVNPEEIGVNSYQSRPDSTTPDFIIGASNNTEIIRLLKGLNGVTLDLLERWMRPDSHGRTASIDGFLGNNESLTDILVLDNDFVKSRDLNHQDMALPLKYIRALADLGVSEFTFRDNHYKMDVLGTICSQQSPFGDDASDGRDVTVYNLTNGKSLHFGLLLADLVERWGFYEGRGTKYRLEPQSILEAFPYLQNRRK